MLRVVRNVGERERGRERGREREGEGERERERGREREGERERERERITSRLPLTQIEHSVLRGSVVTYHNRIYFSSRSARRIHNLNRADLTF